MTINIVCIGKLNEKWHEAFFDYQKKINFYSKVNVIEIKESNYKNIDLQIAKESELIIELIPKNSYVILCSLKGKEMDSTNFSKVFENNSNVTFVIGGSHGVNEDLFKNKICFSRMTMAHQLFRVVLMEQIFRAFSILKDTKYHK